MRALILLVTCASAHLCVTGCKKRDQVEPTSPVRVVEPIPSISPRAQFKRTTNPGEKPRGPIVRNLLLSADGKRLAVVGPYDVDRTQIWSIDGEPRKLSDIDGLVNLLLPDGKRAIGQDKDYGNSFVVELATGQKSPVPDPLGNFLFASEDTAIVPLISHSWDRPEPFQLSLFDTRGGKSQGFVKVGNDNRVRCALINQGREVLYVLPRENRGVVYDWKAKKTTREFRLAGKENKSRLNDTAWKDLRISQPDGKWIAVARTFGTQPEIFDGRTGEVAAKVSEAPYSIPGEFVPGKDLFIYNSSKNPRTPKINGMVAYGIKEGNYRAYFQDYTSPVISLSFSGDGRVMATGHEDGSILIWNLDQIK